jgi:hypothetical protein
MEASQNRLAFLVYKSQFAASANFEVAFSVQSKPQ